MIAKAKKFILDVMNQPEVTENMDLQDLFDFLEHMEKLIPEVESYKAFKSLIKNMDKCIITGSSVLAYRLGHKRVSKDIDFFIEGTLENIKVIPGFFNDPACFDAFREFAKTKSKVAVFPSGRYQETSFNNTYAMLKLDCTLTTSRFSFDFEDTKITSQFDLNFIFVKRLQEEERRLLGKNEETTSGLYTSIFSSLDSTLPKHTTFFEDNSNNVLNTIIDLYPRGLPAHFVYQSFDFEELKYAYCFELRQVISLPQVGKFLLSVFKRRLDQLISEADPSHESLIKHSKRYALRAESKIKELDIINEKFLKLTSDGSTLNISPDMIPHSTLVKLKNVSNYQEQDIALDKCFGMFTSIGAKRVHADTLSAHTNLLIRIPKYSERGFRIEDPHNITGLCQNYINMYNIYINSNQEVNHIAIKNGITSGIRENIGITRRLRSVYKKFEEIKVENSIKVKEKEQEEVDAK